LTELFSCKLTKSWEKLKNWSEIMRDSTVALDKLSNRPTGCDDDCWQKKYDVLCCRWKCETDELHDKKKSSDV